MHVRVCVCSAPTTVLPDWFDWNHTAWISHHKMELNYVRYKMVPTDLSTKPQRAAQVLMKVVLSAKLHSLYAPITQITHPSEWVKNNDMVKVAKWFIFSVTKFTIYIINGSVTPYKVPTRPSHNFAPWYHQSYAAEMWGTQGDNIITHSENQEPWLFHSNLTFWKESSSKYLIIQSLQKRKHHISPLQQSTG